MSKTSASISSGVQNTEKEMKAQHRRQSAFIVSRCLESLMKREAKVFDMTSQPFFFTKRECNMTIFCFIRQVIVICKGNEY